MIISPPTIFILSFFLALPSSTLSFRFPFRDDEPPTLCYDARYASSEPQLDDCTAIIAHQILTPEYEHRDVIFTRRPTSAAAYRVPKTWTTPRGGCRVVIDIPEGPRQPILGETASMLEVKTAAVVLMARCVIKGDHLGGVAAVGRKYSLQVSLEGPEEGETNSTERERVWGVGRRYGAAVRSEG
ncbi:MAG: hypothetical protein LQ348_004547 [Seirophora lacunosa]|nr:MAG: hypothetical protein LQ344_000058 [Seirophora lacunosa]KAI4184447.1 MAG: hypothetical protein LQ348_004547 [Seirophora lacunosa]